MFKDIIMTQLRNEFQVVQCTLNLLILIRYSFNSHQIFLVVFKSSLKNLSSCTRSNLLQNLYLIITVLFYLNLKLIKFQRSPILIILLHFGFKIKILLTLLNNLNFTYSSTLIYNFSSSLKTIHLLSFFNKTQKTLRILF